MFCVVITLPFAILNNERLLILHQIRAPFINIIVIIIRPHRYGDGAGNTVEENSSVFSLIRMR